MIDAGLLRSDLQAIRRSQRRRGLSDDLAELVDLDQRLRSLRGEAESVRAEQRDSGRRIAQLSGTEKEQAIAAAAELASRYKELNDEVSGLASSFDSRLAQVPNLVGETAAEGFTDADNFEIRRVGEARQQVPADHIELGERLGIIDMERGSKVSGARFGYLKGPAALLEFALIQWAMGRLVEAGFTPVVPPVLVKEEALYGTGFFPGDREQVYAVEADELYLVGTSEVSLAAMHMDEILAESDLPLRYAGFSTCFRREAGSYGKDVKGLFRVHQFDKVEMFAFVRPETSDNEHERLLSVEEGIVAALGLPYRVVNVAAGDLGSSAAKKYDIEAWFPGQVAYREITSCSNTTDYQARRLKARFRSDDGNRLVHTLNGTAVAVGRTLLAILENYQRDDGSVEVPPVLVPFTNFETIGP